MKTIRLIELRKLVKYSYKRRSQKVKYRSKCNELSRGIKSIIAVFPCPLHCNWDLKINLHSKTKEEVIGNLTSRIKSHLYEVHNIRVIEVERTYQREFKIK